MTNATEINRRQCLLSSIYSPFRGVKGPKRHQGRKGQGREDNSDIPRHLVLFVPVVPAWYFRGVSYTATASLEYAEPRSTLPGRSPLSLPSS